jgi:hypothetical protein
MAGLRVNLARFKELFTLRTHELPPSLHAGETYAGLPDSLYVALTHSNQVGKEGRGPLIGPLAYAHTETNSPSTTLSFRFAGTKAEQRIHAQGYGFDTTFYGEPWADFDSHGLGFYQGRYSYPHKAGSNGPDYHGYLHGQLTAGRFHDE